MAPRKKTTPKKPAKKPPATEEGGKAAEVLKVDRDKGGRIVKVTAKAQMIRDMDILDRLDAIEARLAQLEEADKIHVRRYHKHQHQVGGR